MNFNGPPPSSAGGGRGSPAAASTPPPFGANAASGKPPQGGGVNSAEVQKGLLKGKPNLSVRMTLCLTKKCLDIIFVP